MPEEVFIMIVLGMAFSLAWGILGFVKSIALKRMEMRGGDTDGLRNEVDELSRRVDELAEGTVTRLQEVEERLDFAERLLATQRDRARLKEE